jgi:predicted NBD/HSP70 family sugar kinase
MSVPPAPDARTALGIDVGGTSIKLALLRGGRAVRTGRSRTYDRPSFDTLAATVRDALDALPLDAPADAVGLCAPGLRDPATGIVTAAVNLPGLVGRTHADLLAAAGHALPPPALATDAHAAAHDWWTLHPAPGRLLAISLGTGVGACVLDDGVPLIVSGAGPGHLGQIDVGLLGGDRPTGPDGSAGSLEAYLGLPALRARFGDDLPAALPTLDPRTPPLRALVQALRISHALYRPDRIVLLGGVGLALAQKATDLCAAVADGLTGLARPGWTLAVGDDPFHAARGAARLAR